MMGSGGGSDSWADALLRLFDGVTKGKRPLSDTRYRTHLYPQVVVSTAYGFDLGGWVNNAAIMQHMLVKDRFPYEPLTTFLSLMLSRRGGMYVDIGANIGYFSLLASVCAAQPMEVHAFEPSAENFQFLQDNIARNGCQGQIRAYPIGIGSADTVEELSFMSSRISVHLSRS